MTNPSEQWRWITPRYEISSLGRLRRHDKSGTRIFLGSRTRAGYVAMCVGCKPVFRHVLIARAFLGEPEPGQMVRHLNGIPGDDRIENLAWGTPKENAADSKLHRTNYALRKTARKHGHDFTSENTFIDNLGRRICRTCKRGHMRAGVAKVSEARRLAREARRPIAEVARYAQATQVVPEEF